MHLGMTFRPQYIPPYRYKSENLGVGAVCILITSMVAASIDIFK